MTDTNKLPEILFQKLGNTWFAFSEVEGDVIYSALPEGIDPKTTDLELYEVIEEHMQKISSINKSTSTAT